MKNFTLLPICFYYQQLRSIMKGAYPKLKKKIKKKIKKKKDLSEKA
jgi:hypothetical protein